MKEKMIGAKAYQCLCGMAKGHEGPHECADQEHCGGSWKGSPDGGDFEVVTYPGSDEDFLVALANLLSRGRHETE